jgi:hypothetical protein
LCWTIPRLEFIAYILAISLDNLVTEPLCEVMHTFLWLPRPLHWISLTLDGKRDFICISAMQFPTAMPFNTLLNHPRFPLLVNVLLEFQTEVEGVNVRPDPRERFSKVLRRTRRQTHRTRIQ